MYRKEVNQRSPLRVFERSTHGGLGPGNLGVVLGRAGIGKFPFLVGIALDDLMRRKRVLHIGVNATPEKIRAYYDEIFHALAASTELQERDRIRLEIESHRMIHTYRDDFSLEKLRGALGFMKEHMDFEPGLIAINGYPNWDRCGDEEISGLKEIAVRTGSEIWLSAQTHREGEELDARGVPLRIARFEEHISVMVRLQPQTDHIQLELVKDHENEDLADLHLELDPGTLLLRWW